MFHSINSKTKLASMIFIRNGKTGKMIFLFIHVSVDISMSSHICQFFEKENNEKLCKIILANSSYIYCLSKINKYFFEKCFNLNIIA